MDYSQSTISFSWGRPTGKDSLRELVRRMGKALRALA
jgi:hypothetical protein